MLENMLEFDYTYKKDGKTYKPNIDKVSSGLLYVRGPSGKGKSTWLMIFAMEFFGIEDNQRNDREYINMMKAILRRYIVWTIKIHIADGTILFSEKLDGKIPEFKVGEIINGEIRLLNSEQFFTKYNNLYMLPSNPKEKLGGLTKSLKDGANILFSELTAIEKEISGNITEIKSKDPDRVERLHSTLKEQKKDLKTLKAEQKQIEEQSKSLKIYTYNKYEEYYKDKINYTSKSLSELDRKIDSDDYRAQKIAQNYYNTISKIENMLDSLNTRFNDMYSILKVTQNVSKYNLDTWANINFNDAKNNYEKIDEMKSLVINILGKLDNEKNKSKIKDREVKFIRKMYDDAIAYRDVDTILGKLSTKLFIQDLEQRVNIYGYIIKNNENIDRCIEKLANIKIDFESLDQLCDIVKSTKHEINIGIKKINVECISMEDIGNRDILRKNLTYYQKKYADYINYKSDESDLDFTPDQNYDAIKEILSKYEKWKDEDIIEKEFEKDINSLENRKINKRAKINITEENIKITENEIGQLVVVDKPEEQKKRLGKLENNLKDVANFRKKIIDYQQNLNRLDGYAKNYAEAGITPNFSKGEEIFYDYVFSYLGQNIGTIICGDNEMYEIKYFNSITKDYVTKEGKIIDSDSVSTGQTQSNLLRGKLNIESRDNRRIIALCDEISTIAGSPLKIVMEDILELEKKGNLISAILVQSRPGDIKTYDFKKSINFET